MPPGPRRKFKIDFKFLGRLLPLSAALTLTACAEIEIYRIPNNETGNNGFSTCKDQTAKAPKLDAYKVEAACLALIPGSRVETYTVQPRTGPPKPQGCSLLSIVKGPNSERWIYSCPP